MLADLLSVQDDWHILALSSAAIFLAAIVRGFSGFGFSLLSITAISLIQPVAQIVPTIFLMEITASLNMIPGLWREIHWRSLLWLMVGYVIGLPLGTYVLMAAPAAPAQIALGLLVIGTATLMLNGFRLRHTPAAPATTATGGLSGILNGAFGIGGPPVILFYFSTPEAASVGRASIIAYFLLCDLIGTAYFLHQGLVTQQSLVQYAIWLPMLLLGIAVGARVFQRMDQERFRRWVLILLVALAILGIAKAVIDLG